MGSRQAQLAIGGGLVAITTAYFLLRYSIFYRFSRIHKLKFYLEYRRTAAEVMRSWCRKMKHHVDAYEVTSRECCIASAYIVLYLLAA